MSLVYMKVLERDPQSYDSEFNKRFPEAEQIYDLIKAKIGTQGRVLEIGCGTGRLVIDMAKQGLNVTAIDISEIMIDHASMSADRESVDVEFINGNFLAYPIYGRLLDSEPYDYIISTFALSELSPLQQALFLKQVSTLLKRKGSCFLAADTAPEAGLARMRFGISNFVRDQISIFKDIPTTNPVKQIETKLEPNFNYKLLFRKKSIRLYEIKKKFDESKKSEDIERVESVLGRYTNLKTAYCIINGLFTRKSIPPGLYRIGNPQRDSPVLVTANYYWTVNSVSSHLNKEKIDCYLLIIDSNGINVWCAAGGGHFTHIQILEALRLFNVKEVINHSTLILPQLSATGVDRKELSKAGWNPVFGPVYINHIKSFLLTFTKEKEAAKVRFGFSFRTLMGIQHAFFISTVLFLPLLLILGLLNFLAVPITSFWISVILELFIIGLVVNMLFIWVYPIFNFTSSFFTKGLIVGGINSVVIILYLASQIKTFSLPNYIFWISLIVVISLFIVLDLAGNTPDTNHLDVESDLTLFIIPAIILIFIAIVIPIVNSEMKHLLF